jgi:hypothetical protein
MVAFVDLKIEVHALTIIAAVLVVVYARAERQIFSIWNSDRVGASDQRLARRLLLRTGSDG